MAYMNWDKNLETGLTVIDKQHKKLIEQINILHTAMHQGKSKDVIENILNELKDYTKYHFSTEEKAFNKYNYKNKLIHARKHHELIKQLDEISQYKTGSSLLSIDLLNFLNKWVKEHILQEDMKYIPELEGKEIAE